MVTVGDGRATWPSEEPEQGAQERPARDTGKPASAADKRAVLGDRVAERIRLDDGPPLDVDSVVWSWSGPEHAGGAANGAPLNYRMTRG